MSTGTSRAASPTSYDRETDRKYDEPAARERLPVARVLALAGSLGLLAGLGEVTLLGIAKFGLGRFTHLNPQLVWLAPLGYALLFTLLAALAMLVGRRADRDLVVRIVSFLALALGGSGILFLHQGLHELAALLLAVGVASQLSLVLARHSALALEWGGRALPPLAGVVLLLFVGLNGGRAWAERRALASLPAAANDAPNVLLIIWDTVRRDNLSLYGYERATTPTLERLAHESLVFDAAFATAPWTTPSHASMFTGLTPAEHGADWRSGMRVEPRTLAEVLAAHGYRTGGFTANTYATARESGLDRGFIHYADFPTFSVAELLRGTSLARSIVDREEWYAAIGIRHLIGFRAAPVVEAELLEWLDRDDARPYFAFVNLFDAHAPYLPPAPYDTAFGPILEGRNPHLVPGRKLTPAEVRAEIDAYDGSIAYLDERLRLLLDTLRQRGRLDNTIVVLSADHGEEFGEHGVFTHGHTLYDRVLRVPLLIYAPDRLTSGARVTRMVSLRDLAATILELAAIDDSIPGRSLMRHVRDPLAGPDTVLAMVSKASGNPSHYPVTRGDMWTTIADPHKLIVNGDGERELYDLRQDPDESRDLSDLAGQSPVRARLESATARLAGRPLPPPR